MASIVEICNLALSHLGSYTINALTEASQEARKCKLYYPAARKFVLRDFAWNFSEKREALALLSGVTPVGFDYAYEYPVDCLKIRRIYNALPGVEDIDYTVTTNAALDSRMILTNEADAILIYSADVEDPNLYDQSFIMMMSYYMASLLAIPLTKKQPIQGAMLQIYGAHKALAETSNAQESRNTTEKINPYISARG